MARSKVEHFVSEETGETYSIFGHPLSDQERERRGQATMIFCPPEEDKTRQEDNVNTPQKMLDRYGPNLFSMNNRGHFDQELDLQAVYDARAAAQRAYEALPAKVRERFRDIHEVARAAETGELSELLKPVADPAPAPPAAEP